MTYSQDPQVILRMDKSGKFLAESVDPITGLRRKINLGPDFFPGQEIMSEMYYLRDKIIIKEKIEQDKLQTKRQETHTRVWTTSAHRPNQGENFATSIFGPKLPKGQRIPVVNKDFTKLLFSKL